MFSQQPLQSTFVVVCPIVFLPLQAIVLFCKIWLQIIVNRKIFERIHLFLKLEFVKMFLTLLCIAVGLFFRIFELIIAMMFFDISYREVSCFFNRNLNSEIRILEVEFKSKTS